MHPIEYKLDILSKELQEKGYNNPLIRNLLKEYLQDIILSVIYNNKKYKDLIFYGGSCLRKIYHLNRLSEDLNFESLKPIDLEDLKDVFLEYFAKEKFEKISISTQKSKNICKSTLKFEIRHTLGLLNNQNEELLVKIEINEKVSREYNSEVTPYLKDTYSMVIKHYPLPTLMASKIVTCISRVYKKGSSETSIKGRDFYDLIWYMEQGIQPNPQVFKDIGKSEIEVFKILDSIVEKINTKDLLIDLEPLFENTLFINNWCNTFHSFYSNYRKNYINL